MAEIVGKQRGIEKQEKNDEEKAKLASLSLSELDQVVKEDVVGNQPAEECWKIGEQSMVLYRGDLLFGDVADENPVVIDEKRPGLRCQNGYEQQADCLGHVADMEVNEREKHIKKQVKTAKRTDI